MQWVVAVVAVVTARALAQHPSSGAAASLLPPVANVLVHTLQEATPPSSPAQSLLACPTSSGARQPTVVSAPPLRIAEAGLPVRAWRVLDARQTIALVRGGASFVRLQAKEIAWMKSHVGGWTGSRQGGSADLQTMLRDVATGVVAAPGVCLAVDNVLSRDWTAALAAAGHGAGEPPRTAMSREAPWLQTELAMLRPRAGFLCNAWAIDGHIWDPARMSKFELQELWANALADRRVLFVIGEAISQTESLLPLVRLASHAEMRRIDVHFPSQYFSGLLSELRILAVSFDTVVLAGLQVGVGALLATGIDCVTQSIDAGAFDVLPRAGRLGSPAPLVSACDVCGARPDPWGGADFHPRPQMRRRGAEWMNLNGWWEVHIGLISDEGLPESFRDGVLEVPFSVESHRGGLGVRVSEKEVVWLRRPVEVPERWAGAMLRIDACDWECSVYVNRKFVGFHRGGYDPFALDITDRLPQVKDGQSSGRTVEVLIRVWDPTDEGCEYVREPPVPCNRCCLRGWQPRGKQSSQPGFIMYSAVTGPWQTVWLEEAHAICAFRSVIVDLVLDGAMHMQDSTAVRITADIERGPCEIGRQLVAAVALDGKEVAHGQGESPFAVELRIPSAKLWSPDDPILYAALVALCMPESNDCADTVEVSFGLRHLSLSQASVPGPSGERELLLNGQRMFQHGVLYQAYWPESLLTPPSAGALVEDIRRIKDSGFNLVRVHAVVMPALFYHVCDQIGLLVWQDFPAGDARALSLWDKERHELEETGTLGLDEVVRTEESEIAFWTELQAMVSWLSAFPSIVCWIPFNEGWGQFATMRVVHFLREFGHGRWVNTASGWNDVADLFPGMDAGDFVDVHNYEGPPFLQLNGTFTSWPLPHAGRALALGEYGGLGLVSDGHEWSPENSWAYGEVSQTSAELSQALERLVSRLAILLCESRISAAVYTQWNDVETEVNGLLTYDRVPKVPAARLRELAATLAEAHARCR